MKNLKIKSILSSVLLASFALAPVSAVLANENENTNSSSTPTTTKYEREGDKKEEGNNNEWKNGTSTAPSTLNDEDKDKKDEKNKNGNNKYGDKFRLGVASTSQNLLKIADKLGAIGAEIRAIVNNQASSSDAIASAVSKVEGRGAFKTFLIGADYKNLGQVISEVAKTQNKLNQLDNQVSKMASSTDKTAVLANIQSLKDQIATLETFIKDNINKFSLFGWFAKRFTK